MKKIIEKFKWLQLILGLVLIALGVLTIVVTANVSDDYEKTIFIVWASVLFFIAFVIILFDLISFNDKPEFSGLILAGMCIGAGIFVLINKEFISQVITTLLPYILISIGGVLLLKTIVLAIRRVAFQSWLLPFILSVVFLTAGIVFICVKDLKQVIYYVVGTLFIVLGAIEIIGYITVLVNRRAPTKPAVRSSKPRKPKKEKPVDAQPVEDNESETVDARPKQIEEQDEPKAIDYKDEEQKES